MRRSRFRILDKIFFLKQIACPKFTVFTTQFVQNVYVLSQRHKCCNRQTFCFTSVSENLSELRTSDKRSILQPLDADRMTPKQVSYEMKYKNMVVANGGYSSLALL